MGSVISLGPFLFLLPLFLEMTTAVETTNLNAIYQKNADGSRTAMVTELVVIAPGAYFAYIGDDSRRVCAYFPQPTRATMAVLDGQWNVSPTSGNALPILRKCQVSAPLQCVFSSARCFWCGTMREQSENVASHTVPSHRECTRCRCAFYCSEECQRQGWPVHSPICRPQLPVDEAVRLSTPVDQLLTTRAYIDMPASQEIKDLVILKTWALTEGGTRLMSDAEQPQLRMLLLEYMSTIVPIAMSRR